MQKEIQAAQAVLMIRPVRFGFNAETAVDNHFQHQCQLTDAEMQARALKEFNNYVAILESKGIEVVAIDDTPEPHTPDSIFPNNWVSFHSDGTVIVYPMAALDRREERREDILWDLERKYGYHVKRIIDITKEEEYGRFLEATGSMIFDYINKIVYACISKRTNRDVLNKVAKELGYTVHAFEDVDNEGVDIYHTNVIMCLGEKFALLWAEGIQNPQEKEELLKSLEETNHEVIFLTFDQIQKFAGNALELANKKGERFLVMADTGVDSLTEDQKKRLSKYVELLPVPLDTIEGAEGGSARCMICDIRLPKKSQEQNE